jgi:hypothetical protein
MPPACPAPPIHQLIFRDLATQPDDLSNGLILPLFLAACAIGTCGDACQEMPLFPINTPMICQDVIVETIRIDPTSALKLPEGIEPSKI